MAEPKISKKPDIYDSQKDSNDFSKVKDPKLTNFIKRKKKHSSSSSSSSDLAEDLGEDNDTPADNFHGKENRDDPKKVKFKSHLFRDMHIILALT